MIGKYLLCIPTFFSMQNDFTSEDFELMPAPSAYKMFKAKTEYPLHYAIRTRREDVVFLYLVEHDSQVQRTAQLMFFKTPY